MRLIFTKNSNNQINVQLNTKTLVEDFNYIEMIKQLLLDKSFVRREFNNLTKDEEIKIQSVLDDLTDVFEVD